MNKTFIGRIGPGKNTRHAAGWVEYGHEQSCTEKSGPPLACGI
jgi:hypothetical protein